MVVHNIRQGWYENNVSLFYYDFFGQKKTINENFVNFVMSSGDL